MFIRKLKILFILLLCSFSIITLCSCNNNKNEETGAHSEEDGIVSALNKLNKTEYKIYSFFIEHIELDCCDSTNPIKSIKQFSNHKVIEIIVLASNYGSELEERVILFVPEKTIISSEEMSSYTNAFEIQNGEIENETFELEKNSFAIPNFSNINEEWYSLFVIQQNNGDIKKLAKRIYTCYQSIGEKTTEVSPDKINAALREYKTNLEIVS